MPIKKLPNTDNQGMPQIPAPTDVCPSKGIRWAVPSYFPTKMNEFAGSKIMFADGVTTGNAYEADDMITTTFTDTWNEMRWAARQAYNFRMKTKRTKTRQDVATTKKKNKPHWRLRLYRAVHHFTWSLSAVDGTHYFIAPWTHVFKQKGNHGPTAGEVHHTSTHALPKLSFYQGDLHILA